jgi:4a-hydroxytetrahydrobiopterin dehydratase
MSILSQIACSPCREGEPLASDEEVAVFHPLVPAWSMVIEDGHRKLRHTYPFDDEATMRVFIEKLEGILRKEGHRAEFSCRGHTVAVTAWTPLLGGLHPNDFIIAAKVDGAYTLSLVGSEGEMQKDGRLPHLEDLPRFRKITHRRMDLP